MKVEAIILLRRTARVVDGGILVTRAEVPDAPEDRDGDTIEEWLAARSLAAYHDGTLEIAWTEVERDEHQTRAEALRITQHNEVGGHTNGK